MLVINQKGGSLVETLIGLSLGILLTFGMMTFYSSSSKISNKTLMTLRLDHEMRTAMTLIENDVRRAGYNAAASSLVGSGKINPFMLTGVSDINVPNSHCILLTYDLNSDGSLSALNTPGSDERFGYRLTNEAIQTRASTDTAFTCDSANWENLTNNNLITVTNLTFSLSETIQSLSTSSSLSIRQVSIIISAKLNSDHNVQRTMASTVRIRNDKYTP